MAPFHWPASSVGVRTSCPNLQQVHHKLGGLYKVSCLPAHIVQWDFFLLAGLTSFFSWAVPQWGTLFLESSNLHFPPSLLAGVSFLSSYQTSRSFTGTFEGPSSNQSPIPKYFNLWLLFFFLKDLIYLRETHMQRERERERGRNLGRRKSRLPQGSLMWD